MRIKGQDIPQPTNEFVVIPRGTGQIVFECKPVINFDEFEALCPVPQPKVKQFPGGKTEADDTNPTYIKQQDDWAQKRAAWMFMESLSATADLEWETVKRDDPETWTNVQSELQKHLSVAEFYKVFSAINVACGLNQEKIDEATADFLAAREATQEA